MAKLRHRPDAPSYILHAMQKCILSIIVCVCVCVCACCRAGGGASSRAEVEELREENERVVMQLVEKQMELAMLSEAEVGGWGLRRKRGHALMGEAGLYCSPVPARTLLVVANPKSAFLEMLTLGNTVPTPRHFPPL